MVFYCTSLQKQLEKRLGQGGLQGREVKKISSLEEMRELLVDAEEEDLDEIAYLTFRCKRLAASEDQNETVKKAVAMAESIAELLPTWREVAQGARSCVDRGDYVELREAVLSRTFLFQATCELVSSLTTAGFGLIHDDFAPRALQLHKCHGQELKVRCGSK